MLLNKEQVQYLKTHMLCCGWSFRDMEQVLSHLEQTVRYQCTTVTTDIAEEIRTPSQASKRRERRKRAKAAKKL